MEKKLHRGKPAQGGSLRWIRSMQQFVSILSIAMGSAFASATSAHVHSSMSFPPNSKQDGGTQSEEWQESANEKELDTVDDHDKSIENLIGI